MIEDHRPRQIGDPIPRTIPMMEAEGSPNNSTDIAQSGKSTSATSSKSSLSRHFANANLGHSGEDLETIPETASQDKAMEEDRPTGKYEILKLPEDPSLIHVYAWEHQDKCPAEYAYQKVNNDYFAKRVRFLSKEEAKKRMKEGTPTWDWNFKCLRVKAVSPEAAELIAKELNEASDKLTAVTAKTLKEKWTELFIPMSRFSISRADGPRQAREYLKYNLNNFNDLDHDKSDWKLTGFTFTGHTQVDRDGEGTEKALTLGGSFATVVVDKTKWKQIVDTKNGELTFMDGKIKPKPRVVKRKRVTPKGDNPNHTPVGERGKRKRDESSPAAKKTAPKKQKLSKQEEQLIEVGNDTKSKSLYKYVDWLVNQRKNQSREDNLLAKATAKLIPGTEIEIPSRELEEPLKKSEIEAEVEAANPDDKKAKRAEIAKANAICHLRFHTKKGLEEANHIKNEIQADLDILDDEKLESNKNVFETAIATLVTRVNLLEKRLTELSQSGTSDANE